MSVASRIQEIETHIGDIYDTLEVGGTDLTDLNKNIVNINSSLKDRYKYFLNNGVEVIWNNWEKVIGEGTEFTLENTIQAPMKVNLKGDTYQKTTTGKNIFDKDTLIAEKDNFTRTGQYYIYYELPDEYKAKITVSMSLIGTSQDLVLGFANTKESTMAQNSRILNGGTINSPKTYDFSNEETVYLGIGNGSQISSDKREVADILNNYNIQVELGESATDYEEYTGGIPSPNPDYPQDIQVVSGDNTIEVVGKNLFDENYYENATYYSNIYKYTPMKIKGNRELYIKCVLKNGKTSINGLYLAISSKNNPNLAGNITYFLVTNGNINTTASTDFTGADDLYFTYYPATITPQQIFDTYNIMVSTTSGEYEPYQKESYPINLGNIELCKIGDYQDRIYKQDGKWYLHKEIGKVVLDGSESWGAGNLQGSHFSFFWVTDIIKLNTKTELLIMSDMFTGYANPSEVIYNDVVGITTRPSTSGQGIYLRSNLTTADTGNFKNWLSTHNTEVYYVLATPIYTEITDTTLLSQLEAIKYSYDEQTNISQVNNDMPFKLEVTALKNI